jgi:ankyrin repeat protein
MHLEEACPPRLCSRLRAKGLVEVIDLRIQHGANPRLVNPKDFSCLHSVTHSSDQWALLYVLCQPDIAVDERDNMGLTPLHWAAQQGDKVLVVTVLLEFGANINLVDRNGLTALHWGLGSLRREYELHFAAPRGGGGCQSDE